MTIETIPELHAMIAAKNARLDAAELLRQQEAADAKRVDEIHAAEEAEKVVTILDNDELDDLIVPLEVIALMAKDAERYRWLRDRLSAADFSYGEPPRPVLVFDWPANVGIGGNCDMNIDAAIMAGA